MGCSGYSCLRRDTGALSSLLEWGYAQRLVMLYFQKWTPTDHHHLPQCPLHQVQNLKTVQSRMESESECWRDLVHPLPLVQSQVQSLNAQMEQEYGPGALESWNAQVIVQHRSYLLELTHCPILPLQ